MPVEIQSAVLWTVQNSFMDDVPVDKIKDFQAKLTDYLSTRRTSFGFAARTAKSSR